MPPRKPNAAAAKAGLLRKGRPPAPPAAADLLHTGSTLLNLAITGKASGGFAKGMYVFLVGDSGSGKSWYSLSCLAEAARNPAFKNHRFIYDNVEDGALMDMGRYFGQAVVDRLEPVASTTTDEFYGNMHAALDAGRPLIAILDSMDALSTAYEAKKFKAKLAAAKSGQAAKGSYGDGKAKDNSAGIRQLLPKLRDTGSILIVISQTRDNIDAGPFEPQKTRSGGHALRFYASVEVWTSVVKRLKRKVNGNDRQVGVVSRAVVKKNRVAGREWAVDVPFYYDLGFDDTGSMVDFLLREKHWRTAGKDDADDAASGNPMITATELGMTARKESVIRHIEQNELERDLRAIVCEVWADLEEALSSNRKPRYT